MMHLSVLTSLALGPSRALPSRLFCFIFRYNIPEQCRLDLTEADIKFAKSLLEKVVPVAVSTPDQSSQYQSQVA
jgi:hypothetical protein